MASPQNREEVLFALALERPADKRPALLDAICGGDPALRQRLEALLAARDKAEALTSPSAPAVKATIKLDLADAEDEAVGKTIGRYKILEKVGEGGCGVVYVAEQTEPVRRRVALKVIKLGMDTKQVIARFEAERQALAMMDHPNIAKVLDAGTTETGRPFFVMELVRGIRITDYCDQANLTTTERLDLFIKVCQAIQHAHQKGIIHRDIKPSNILVTMHDGIPVPKVIDFGIAKATVGQTLTDKTLYTQLQQFIGTPAYMSPEQAEMSGLDIDTRSDIYSLGVLLYELLAGSTPFDAKELMSKGIDAMRKTIREKEPVRPSTRFATLKGEELTTTAKRRSAETSKLLHQLKGDLDWIVMKCLEKDRTRRYETASGLASDLKRHLENEPVAARPPSTAYRFQKAIRRNKLLFSAGLAVVLALAAGLSLAAMGWRQTRVERDNALQARAGEEAQRKTAQANEQKAQAQTLAARRLLYAADMRLAHQAWEAGNLSRMVSLLDTHRPQPGEPDEAGFEYFYLHNLAKGDQELVLYHDTNAVLGVAISPDGKWLAARTKADIHLWDLASRTVASTFSTLRTNADALREDPSECNVSFSHDSQYLSIATKTGLLMFHIPTRQTRHLASGPVGWAAFSPVTNLIAFNGSQSKVHVWDYVANKEVDLPELELGFGWSHDGTRLLTERTSANVISWDTVTWSRAQTNIFESRIWSVDFSPNGRLMAAADWQGTVHLMESLGEKEIGTIHSGDIRAMALAFSPDGELLATASDNQAIQIWDVATRQRVHQLRGHTGRVTSLAFTPDGRILASAGMDGDVRLWNPTRQTGTLQMTNGLNFFGNNPPKFSPDGKWLGIQTNRDTSLVLDSSDLQVSGSVAGEIVSFSPDGRQLATGLLGNLPELRVWTVGVYSNPARVHLDTSPSGWRHPRLSPDGQTIALSTLQGYPDEGPQWELFAAATGQNSFSRSIRFPAGCFLPDGRTWAYADGSQIKFLDLQSHANMRTLECNSMVDFVAVSPDGKTLAASHEDHLVSLWDLQSGTRLGTLSGHQGLVYSLAFTPDGRTLASGSEDCTIKLWNLATQRELASFVQEKGVYWLAFSPDDQMLVSGGIGSYQFWRAPRDEATAPPSVPKLSLADLPTNSIWRLPDGANQLPPRMAAEQEQCFTNLLRIHAAIMAYRKDHQKMPDWLSDLVPQYLSDTNCLICPVCARTGEKPQHNGRDDPRLTCSYSYEFDAHTEVYSDPYGVASPGDTMKAWKEKQLARYGPVVPVLRCRMHPQSLSVTLAGERRVDTVNRWDVSSVDGEEQWADAAEQGLKLNQGAGTNAVPVRR